MSRSTYTKAEIKKIEADRDWWQELATALGWRLYGFTYRQSATFVDSVGDHIQITYTQRNDILREKKPWVIDQTKCQVCGSSKAALTAWGFGVACIDSNACYRRAKRNKKVKE